MNLSPHYTEEELGVQDQEDRIKDNARYLCEQILEPIRAQYSVPMHITSGYRSPAHNIAVGGVHKANHASEHEYEDDHAAADFEIPGIALTSVFNWIRIVSGLPFRQVIIEYENGEPACIHISCRVHGNDKREALIGHTHGNGTYERVEVA